MSLIANFYSYNSSDDDDVSVEGRTIRIPVWSSLYEHRQSDAVTYPPRRNWREESAWEDEEVPSNPPCIRKGVVNGSDYDNIRQWHEERNDGVGRFQERWSSNWHRQRYRGTLVVLCLIFTFLLGFFVGGLVLFTLIKGGTVESGTQTGSSDTTNGTYPPLTDETDSPDSDSTSPPLQGIMVGAYYYPWYKDDFHRGDGYVRKLLSPPQQPWLGEYDDTNPATISQHLQWSRQANVHLWVSSWWGPGSREDVTLRESILTHPELNDHKVALFYETTGRIKESEGYSTERVAPDLEYVCQEYFDHPNYLRIDGKPVLFVYLTRKLEANGTLETVMGQMRSAAFNAGCNEVYIVGDHAFQGAPETEDVYPPLTILDAVTNYDVYGGMGGEGGYVGRDRVVQYYEEQGKWRSVAQSYNCSFIPAASPGYNDLGVRPEKQNPPLSRRLSATDEQGSLFEVSLQEARQLVDPKALNMLIVNSFNEWHEDTQIEPAIGTETSQPATLTYDIVYTGYGELYLDILRRETQSTTE